MDTPGILYPKITSPEVGLNLASFASINEDILNTEEIATYILEVLFKNYPDILNRRYPLPFPTTLRVRMPASWMGQQVYQR